MICICLSTFAEPHQSMVDEKGPLFTLGVHVDCAASLFALGQSELGRGCTFAYGQAFYTHIGKQGRMEDILRGVPDLEAVVFIDGDMAFSPLDFEELVKSGRSTGEMVGAFYPSRQRLDDIIGTVSSGRGEEKFSLVPVPCTYVGLGFTWVPAGVFKAFRTKPWVDVRPRADGTWELEDQYFSRKVLEETPYRIWGRAFPGVSHAFSIRRSMETMLVTGRGV